MSGLVVGGAEHAAVGVTATRVVPRFDPLEDRERELLAGVPAVLVEQLELQRPEEAFDDTVVVASPTEPIEPNRPAARSRWPNAQDVYCAP